MGVPNKVASDCIYIRYTQQIHNGKLILEPIYFLSLALLLHRLYIFLFHMFITIITQIAFYYGLLFFLHEV